MPYTEADLLAVRAEMQAVRSTTFGDRSVTRRSMDELVELESRILSEIAIVSTTRRSKQTLAVASKGF